MKTLPRTKRVESDSRLRRTVVFLDCGDTLVDEGSEIKDKNDVTVRARMIPGAARAVRKLKRMGYTLALVADGPRGTFENILIPRGLFELFDAYAISHEVGIDKPDRRMFLAALNALNIPPEQYKNVVMVGNNLFRDIKGANDLGLVTVWLDWAPRRSKIPANPSEVPNFTIKKPSELIRIIGHLEKAAETDAERTDE